MGQCFVPYTVFFYCTRILTPKTHVPSIALLPIMIEL